MAIEYMTVEEYYNTYCKPVQISRARAERAFRADVGCAVIFHKGKYGHKYDYYTCANCGRTVSYGVSQNYCWGCGFQLNWDNPRCLTGYKG